MTERSMQKLALAVFLVVSWISFCSAQVQCSGTLTGTINNNVACNGDCVLNGATINGNVQCSTGTLVANGNTVITGTVTISGSATSATLEDVIVLGATSVTSASSLVQFTLTSSANLTSVTVTDTPGDTVLAGTITSFSLTNSGDLFVDGLTTTGSITVTGGNGVVEICGSTIGSLLLDQRTGDVDIDASVSGCAATTLNVGFTATKGTGAVTLNGATLSNGDFIVSEYNGDVILQDTEISDLLISKSKGSLTVTNVDADSDTSITEQDGSVTLTNFDSLGDFLINDVTGNLEFKDSDSGLEDVIISFVDGTVTVKNNVNLNLEVKETGGMVMIADNTVTNSNISKNTGGVSIVGNTFNSLSCSDNTPAPTGSGNTVTFPDGQCASGFP